MHKIQIIAEPANYWHGDFGVLKGVMMESVASQADFFKLQVYNPEKLGNKFQAQRKRYDSMEITGEQLVAFKEQCDKYGVKLLCTVNTTDRVDLIHSSDVTNIKIASGQIHPLLVQAIEKYHWERVFVSTGMLGNYPSTQIALINKLRECADEVVIMHCVSLYPTHDSEVNLSRILTLKDSFPWASVGYSDHNMDDLACILSMAMGAKYVEKHVAIEQCFGPTCEISANPEAFDRLCGVRKRVERLLGEGGLECQPREHDSIQHYKGRYLLDG